MKPKEPENKHPDSLASVEQAAKTFRALLHHANDLVYAVSIDPDERTWQLEFLSDRIFDFSGCRAEEFIQGGPLGTGGPFGLANPEEHPFELVHPEDMDKVIRETRLLTEGERVVREYRMRNKRTGEYRWVEDRSEPERDSAGRVVGIWGIVRDLTERKQLEQQLFQSQKMEAVGRLAGGIAHDFNNILTVILGLTETLIQDLSAIDDAGTLREDARTVRKEAVRAASLTQQLLAFSRKQLLQPRAISLGRVVEDMQAMFERLIGEDIEMWIQPGETSTVQADPAQIQQVLLNLVVNAREAMPEGGRLIIETANVELDEDYAQGRVGVRPGSHVMLAVSDTGVGMDSETLRQAFDPFFTTRVGGTGLGLSTVYGIVKQSGGNVWAYSELEKGTTFKVYLPRVDQPESVDGRSNPESDDGLHGTETVLVVEDEAGVRTLMRKTLEFYGYDVIDAADGLEACELAESFAEPIDLLLTDLVMPRMSGLDLARRIRQDRPDIQILYTSGYTEGFVKQDRDREELGNALIEKPFTLTSLARRVREVLSARA